MKKGFRRFRFFLEKKFLMLRVDWHQFVADLTDARGLEKIYQKITALQTLLVSIGFYLVVDSILTQKFGKKYESLYPPIAWITTPFTFYVVIGPALYVARKFRTFPMFSWFLWFVASLGALGLINQFLVDKFPSLLLLQNILALFILIILVASFFLLVFRFVKIRTEHFLWIFRRISAIRISVSLSQILAIVLIFMLYSANLKFQKLNTRLDNIETRLGGAKKILCNEKESIDKIRKSVVRVIGGEAEGSGFAIDSDGLILTNFHVIEFEPSPKVIFSDNSFEVAEILRGDKDADLAILKVNVSLVPITWGKPSELSSAEELLAVGYPLGGELVGEASVNKGFLSGRRFSKDVGIEYLQTDATFTGGVSGGPMINICGEVVGINTAGLAGLGLAISADSIRQKMDMMTVSDDATKDIKKITFDDTTSAEFAVATFYNYLKVRKMDKAFEILSDNFKKGHTFDYWKGGYESLLDTTVIKIEEDTTKKDRIDIKLSTKDMVDDEIVYKYFEGYWDVRKIDGKWRLWDPEIKEVEDPSFYWFYE